MTPLHDDPHLAALLAHWQAPAPRAGAVDAILARAAGTAQDLPAAQPVAARPWPRHWARHWMALAASVAMIMVVSGSWYAAHQPGTRSADSADILDENALDQNALDQNALDQNALDQNALALVFSEAPDIRLDFTLETL